MDVIKTLLEKRGLKTEKEIEEFFNPPPPEFKLDSKKAVARIEQAIKNQESIIVYGDYDADGICATAIMWEALNSLGAKALPFIPSREKEGYGLSIDGVKQIDAKLIIVVDSGVVAHEAVDYAKKRGIDVIILDHHERPEKLPKAAAIVWTDKLCAAGIAYFVAKELGVNVDLSLTAIATVTDLMPLVGTNRSIVKHGLEELNKTARPGLKALFEIAGIKKIGTYEIGFMIGPRLNAAGRIENALFALRLLCTKNPSQAKELAEMLNTTNKERQLIVEEQTRHAIENAKFKMQNSKVIVIEHESYHQGVIGLIAGKLVEKYYLPTIVIAKDKEISKASARSIAGFNIIEAIRTQEKLLINAGGHPMAAGFTIENHQIAEFKSQLTKLAAEKITGDMLKRTVRIDCEISDLSVLTLDFYHQLQQFAPFGLGNPEPVFASDVLVQSIRTVGQDGKHLKLVVSRFDAIAFNQGSLAPRLQPGTKIHIVYSLDLNSFNGREGLQLKVKEITVSP